MIIHNIMEDMVRELIDEIFNDRELLKKETFCSCYQCKGDVMCYVLNRISPIYIFTSRGATRFKMNYLDNLQRKADIATLIHRGIKRVGQAKRPHFLHKNEIENRKPHGFFYNIPPLTGKAINSITFEPLGSISVTLHCGGKPVEMINPNWQNPYVTHTKTAGIFTFFPRPLAADRETIEKKFEFELVVEDKGYESYRRYFEVNVTSTDEYIEYYRYNSYIELEDVFLIPKQPE